MFITQTGSIKNASVLEVVMKLEELISQNKITLSALTRDMSSYYVGRATPKLLDTVMINYHGNSVPIEMCATIQAISHDMLLVRPWERAITKDIERAIHGANLGLSPQADSEVVKVFLPRQTKENYIKIFSLIKDRAQAAKISVRHNRKLCRDTLGSLTDDERALVEKTVQRETDETIASIDLMLARKKQSMRI